MNREPVSKSERAHAVRALLVSLPGREAARRGHANDSRSLSGHEWGWSWVRPAGAIAIVVVFVAVAYFGLTAVRRGALTPAVVPSVATSATLDKTSIRAGTVLGAWSSEAKPISYGGTVSPRGLAISMTITCSGDGSLAVSISHVLDQDGSCGHTGGRPQTSGSSGGISTPVTVKIRPHGRDVTWRVTLRAATPTTFKPVPVRAVNSQGQPVPYCSSSQLSAKYVHVPEPDGVTAATTGEVVVTNTGSHLCAVSGYPTGFFVTGDGIPIGHHANMSTDSKRYSTRRTLEPVLMQPGQHAYLQLNAGHANTIKDCRPTRASALRFSGDNDGFSSSTTFTVSVPPMQACSNGKVLQLFSTMYVDYPADLRTPAQITKAVTCRLDELAIAPRATPDQRGEQTAAISFRNTGTRTCHLNGTPALTFIKDDGTPVGRHTGVQLHGGDPSTLDDGYTLLAPGKTLYVHYAIQKASAIANCAPTTVHRLRITTGEFGYSTTIALPSSVRSCTRTAVTQLRATGFITERDYKLVSLP